MKKILLVVLIFTFFTFLKAKPDSTLVLPNTIATDINKAVTLGDTLFLSCNQANNPTFIKIKEILFNKKYIISKVSKKNYVNLYFLFNSTFSTKTEKSFWGDTIFNVNSNQISLEINQNNKVTFAKTYTQKTIKKQNNQRTYWYDSVLITSIIGGLVYLFYYGNH